jgi:adenylate cyclase
MTLGQGCARESPLQHIVFLLAASLPLAGRLEEAQPIVQRLLDLEPGFRLRLIFEVGVARAVTDRLAEGGRMLGLPE